MDKKQLKLRAAALLLAAMALVGLLAGCGGSTPEPDSAGVPYISDELHLLQDADAAVDSAVSTEQERLDEMLELYDSEEPEAGQPELLTPAPAEEASEVQEEETLPAEEELPPEEAAAAVEEPASAEETVSAEEPAPAEESGSAEDSERSVPAGVTKDGEYTTPEEVAEYIHTFGRLPGNFITKNKARDLGWDSGRGNLWDVAPGKSIGGDRFGNYEGLLPNGKYRECDVNYAGGYRGSERLIYGEDGSIYYTSDHYSSFTRLY